MARRGCGLLLRHRREPRDEAPRGALQGSQLWQIEGLVLSDGLLVPLRPEG
jgi:hypothetical protein